MTDSKTENITCPICFVEYSFTYPLRHVWIACESWSMPEARKYYKAKARIEHNATHKGEMDNWVK